MYHSKVFTDALKKMVKHDKSLSHYKFCSSFNEKEIYQYIANILRNKSSLDSNQLPSYRDGHDGIRETRQYLTVQGVIERMREMDNNIVVVAWDVNKRTDTITYTLKEFDGDKLPEEQGFNEYMEDTLKGSSIVIVFRIFDHEKIKLAKSKVYELVDTMSFFSSDYINPRSAINHYHFNKENSLVINVRFTGVMETSEIFDHLKRELESDTIKLRPKGTTGISIEITNGRDIKMLKLFLTPYRGDKTSFFVEKCTYGWNIVEDFILGDSDD